MVKGDVVGEQCLALFAINDKNKAALSDGNAALFL